MRSRRSTRRQPGGHRELYGTRFAAYPNIIWCFVGDRSSPTGTHLTRTDAFITGVRASLGATDRFITIHPGRHDGI